MHFFASLILIYIIKQPGPRKTEEMLSLAWHSTKTLITTNSTIVSHSSSIKDDMNLDLEHRKPAQQYLSPPPRHVVDSWAKSLKYNITVTAKSPYLILGVSKELSYLLEFNDAGGQLCGRSINVVCGPETDKMSLVSAIKHASKFAANEICEGLSIKIYGQNGTVHAVKTSCSIREKSEEGNKVSCFIRFEMEAGDASWSRQDQRIDPSRSNWRRDSLPSSRTDCRARYNFLTGLETERELLHAMRRGSHCELALAAKDST